MESILSNLATISVACCLAGLYGIAIYHIKKSKKQHGCVGCDGCGKCSGNCCHNENK